MRAIVLVPFMLLAACSSANSQSSAETGSGSQRSYALSGFDKIDLSGASDVIVRTGSDASVRAEGRPEALDRLEIEVDGDTLRIGHKKGNWGFDSGRHGHTKVYVTLPALAAAGIGGSGDIDIDKVDGEQFEGSVAGSGNIRIAALNTGSAAFSIAGSGGIKAAGSTSELKMNVAGSGNLDLADLHSQTAEVSVAGSGDVHANAARGADISIIGSGNVRMDGTAKCSISKIGSGRADCGA